MPQNDDPRLTTPQCHSLQPVTTNHTNLWFSVKNRGGYFTIEDNTPQVQLLPIVENKSIVMVRVYRPVIADNTLELPAGGTNKDESPIEAAVRELHEETGILVPDQNRFQILPPLIHVARNPILPHIFQIHLARQEYDLRMDHDHEILGVECLSYKEVLQNIERGEIYVGPQIAIILRYFLCNHVIQ